VRFVRAAIVLLRHDNVESNNMGDTMKGSRFACLGLMRAAALVLAATGPSAEGLGDRGSVKDGPYAGPLRWTGFYVGAAVGYGTGTTELGDPFQTDVSLRGVQGPSRLVTISSLVHGGCWVCSATMRSAKSTAPSIPSPSLPLTSSGRSADGLASWRRLRDALVYLGRVHAYGFEASQNGVTLVDETLDGFFVGLGVEQAINRNLSLKLDYRFSDYEDFMFNNGHQLRQRGSLHPPGRNLEVPHRPRRTAQMAAMLRPSAD
jgi:opacity protein-like surface antigen